MNDRKSSKAQAARMLFVMAAMTMGLVSASLTYADDVNVTSNTGAVNVPDGKDVEFISMKISTPARRELVIHYSAECLVQSGYIEYDILVDNVPVSPTHDGYNALCSTPAPMTGATTVSKTVGIGEHLIQVRGHVEIGFGGQIDDQSLVVTEEGP